METKRLTIICITIIIVVIIICGTIICISQLNTDNTKNNNTTQDTNNNTTQDTNNNTTTKSSNNEITKNTQTQQSTKDSKDTDSDGYIDGNKITYRNKNYLGEDSNLEKFSTSEDAYIKQKSTGKIAKRHLDSDGAYRYYDMETGECVMG